MLLYGLEPSPDLLRVGPVAQPFEVRLDKHLGCLPRSSRQGDRAAQVRGIGGCDGWSNACGRSQQPLRRSTDLSRNLNSHFERSANRLPVAVHVRLDHSSEGVSVLFDQLRAAGADGAERLGCARATRQLFQEGCGQRTRQGRSAAPAIPGAPLGRLIEQLFD